MIIPSMSDNLRTVIIGATGGIGAALRRHLSLSSQVTEIYALSRSGQAPSHYKIKPVTYDFINENNVKSVAEMLHETGKFDLIICATGLLHGEGIAPEKSMRTLAAASMLKSFEINAIGPALTAKYLLPLLARNQKTVFAALSARVGSISDNRLGGWHSYRASKAALNMIIKSLSIEFGRSYPEAIIVGLHPGTVDTRLSAPFQSNVQESKLFTPEFSARCLLSVIDSLTVADTGDLFAWNREHIPF